MQEIVSCIECPEKVKENNNEQYLFNVSLVLLTSSTLSAHATI